MWMLNRRNFQKKKEREIMQNHCLLNHIAAHSIASLTWASRLSCGSNLRSKVIFVIFVQLLWQWHHGW
eukprot:s233_g41.t1